MSPVELLNRLRDEGLTITPKLRLDGARAPSTEVLELIAAHRDELLFELVGLNAVPRLPWQLEALLRAASDGVLDVSLGGIPDSQRYVLGHAASYLTGDHQEALRRLWTAHRAWQGVN